MAFSGLRTPTTLWTYTLPEDADKLDRYFQQHLLMDVYPMAPMPKNDHSIQPGHAATPQAASLAASLVAPLALTLPLRAFLLSPDAT